MPTHQANFPFATLPPTKAGRAKQKKANPEYSSAILLLLSILGCFSWTLFSCNMPVNLSNLLLLFSISSYFSNYSGSFQWLTEVQMHVVVRFWFVISDPKKDGIFLYLAKKINHLSWNLLHLAPPQTCIVPVSTEWEAPSQPPLWEDPGQLLLRGLALHWAWAAPVAWERGRRYTTGYASQGSGGNTETARTLPEYPAESKICFSTGGTTGGSCVSTADDVLAMNEKLCDSDMFYRENFTSRILNLYLHLREQCCKSILCSVWHHLF